MIPKFPKFKDLELSDLEFVSKVTSKYLPYSDFNFEIMWSWDFNNSAKVSLLNDNLVVIQQNIFTNQITTSFLGNNKLENTLVQLFEFLDFTNSTESNLSLIPEDSLKGLNFKKYFIEIDLNSCDYIFDLKQLSNFQGTTYSKKRGKYNYFLKNYPSVEVSELNLSSKKVREQILNLNNFWAQNKTIIDLETFNENELLAIEKFLDANFSNTYCIGLYDTELIGYSIFSKLDNKFVIGHFTKADISYKGIYEALMNKSAVALVNQGYEYMNFQEDMGLPGLRAAKVSYRPVNFLRKYFVKRL